MGRQRKYTPLGLRRAVDAWFDSITRIVAVTEQVPTGERDERGHPIYEERDVVNRAGEPVLRLEYVIPPTVGGLCRHLEISRETWSQYGDQPGHDAVVQEARDRIQTYLEEELLTRSGKDVKGVMFNLQANYGMSERHEVELSGGALEALLRSERE